MIHEKFTRQQSSHLPSFHANGDGAGYPHPALKGSLATHVAQLAASHPYQPAICDVTGATLTYDALYQHLTTTAAHLNQLGIGRHDRVAIVLPNGPAMATAFLAVAACVTSAPLNPAYRTAEYDFSLVDLNAKAVLVDATMDSPVREVARTRAIPIIEVSVKPSSAGLFTLAGDITGNISGPNASTGLAELDDIALILHTSGTTSRPKMVPLTERNLLRSAHNIAATLALSPADRCLNVMPLFHIHGLVAALLASLVTGGGVVCTPGFDAPCFFPWLRECRPTWYTGVPTMHQAILARAAMEQELSQEARLRFVRSSSSPLPPSVMMALEKTFQAPVIEAYGMTEAAHQMASNPLPPLLRKPGSVGLAAGPQVAIMAEDHDTLLATGAIGEVVIRGENVTLGYLNNVPADHVPDNHMPGNDLTSNAKVFTAGWFRTGDQGYLDEDGYLFLTGRLKELINRGGEKIAPREVDEVLLSHPDVAQAVTFAMPDEKLGEEVAAAVVLRDTFLRDSGIRDNSAIEHELRHFVASHLAIFKTPRRVIVLDEIPKGATGKLQRIGLAEKLGLTTDNKTGPAESRAFVLPRNLVERTLMNLWCEILKVPAISVHQPFLEVGGDSMAATQLVTLIQQTFAIQLSVVDLFDAPTIADQIDIIEARMKPAPAQAAGSQLLRLIQPGNAGHLPLYLVPGGGGSEVDFLTFARLIHLLGADQPVYGFFARGQDGVQPPHATFDELVTDYLHAMRFVQPHGPYLVAGECVGGKVAYEMARRLRQQGVEVAMLLLLNTPLDTSSSRWQRLWNTTVHIMERWRVHWFEVQKRSLAQKGHYLWQRWQHSSFNPKIASQRKQRRADPKRQAHVYYHQTLKDYALHQTYSGTITLLVSEDHYRDNPTLGWDQWAAGELEIYPVPGNLRSYLGHHVQTTAGQIVHCLDKVQKSYAKARSNGEGS